MFSVLQVVQGWERHEVNGSISRWYAFLMEIIDRSANSFVMCSREPKRETFYAGSLFDARKREHNRYNDSKESKLETSSKKAYEDEQLIYAISWQAASDCCSCLICLLKNKWLSWGCTSKQFVLDLHQLMLYKLLRVCNFIDIIFVTLRDHLLISNVAMRSLDHIESLDTSFMCFEIRYQSSCFKRISFQDHQQNIIVYCHHFLQTVKRIDDNKREKVAIDN